MREKGGADISSVGPQSERRCCDVCFKFYPVGKFAKCINFRLGTVNGLTSGVVSVGKAKKVINIKC